MTTRLATKPSTLRDKILLLHRWIGLIVGLFISISGLTGSFLVFSPQMEHWWYAPLLQVAPRQEPMLPLGQLSATVKREYSIRNVGQKYPDIAYIHRSHQEGAAFMVMLKGDVTWWCFDPYTGRFLGIYDYPKTLFGLAYDLHVLLLSGEIGLYIVGVIGCILMGMCLTGLWLWWPRKWVRAFFINLKAGWKRRVWDWHRGFGFVSAGLLFIVAFTGTTYSFYEFYDGPVIKRILGGNAEEPKSTPLPVSSKDQTSTRSPLELLNQIENNAQQAIPTAQIVAISFPSEPDGVYQFKLMPQGSANTHGDDLVAIDRYSARVLRVSDSRNLSREASVWKWRTALHFGHWGGLATQILYVGLGLLPSFLFVTGVLMWLNKKRGRTQRARGRAARNQNKLEVEEISPGATSSTRIVS